jgi:excisionase family DNA binding protein
MSNELLTTAEAARIAGVGASSVKRWADQNLLRCVRTAGGHRRFYRDDLETFLHEHGATMHSGTGEWVEVMLNGGLFEIQGELFRARDRLGAWHAVADEVGQALAELGSRWERGEITVIEEHIASEKLGRAIQRALETIPSSDGDPRALLATASSDEHTLGLALVELCLREANWSTVWTGRRTPADELIDIARSGQFDLIALSASAASSNTARLAGEAKALGEACRQAGAILVLGGGGAWPDDPAYGTRVRDLGTLHRLTTGWRASVARRSG